MLLKDKIVIVSGIGPGLGVKLAVEAAREGAAGVVVAARSADKLDDAEARIKALGVKAKVVKQVCDITSREQCAALAAIAAKSFGRVDALVNSAFFHGNMDYASTANLDEWNEVIQTNLIGTLKLTQAVIPQMKSQKSGAIVMINTMAVRQVPPLGEAGYAASKAALGNSAKWLAKELGPDGIRVNTVHMGWMWGAPVQGYMEWQAKEMGVPVEQLVQGISANIPLGRMPTDDECARAALFLVSDYASAVTGAALDANGGMYMP
ncbi:SDR family oxidoreductase [Solimonas sp. K1W22B-7]|uniref:SDR family oxidoreductase n=1 Tax=Solimonas sp. K1W22B-7 TaxID=2303331 RepID=UPI000E32F3E6|nr:SDR family oxidoreductase [Solimonas sp. K1W22B-7]AXQ30174.1 SDR family oxidoreductase [Solimonas sp. K1W22B-7]